MNIDLVVIGKTDSQQVSELVEMYRKRINFYCKFSLVVFARFEEYEEYRRFQPEKQEGEMLLRQIADGDYLVLLDERGHEFRSMGFAAWLQKRMNGAPKRLVFVIGGPYGFSQEVYDRADDRISLSRMTFSHQIVRALFAEQLYRAFTILNNEPYHHE